MGRSVCSANGLDCAVRMRASWVRSRAATRLIPSSASSQFKRTPKNSLKHKKKALFFHSSTSAGCGVSHCASNCRSFWLEGLSAKLGGSLGSINKTTVISMTIYLRETLPNLRPPSNPNMDKMEKPDKHVCFHGRFTSTVGVLPVYSFSPSCSRIFRLEVPTINPTRWWHQRKIPPQRTRSSIVFFCSFGVGLTGRLSIVFCSLLSNDPKFDTVMVISQKHSGFVGC